MSFAHALLVEDEPNLISSLKIALKKLDIPTSFASTLEEARDLVRAKSPDFILLDRALPDGDGLELCKYLRSIGYGGMILMLTAAGLTEQRVEGLKAGADDYLGKPFSWGELEARIVALARRKENAPATPITTTALWTLDETRLRVLGPKGWVTLTPLEFKLASRLVGAQGTIVTRDDLLKNVWGFKFLPKTRTVDHFLGRLRKHFEMNPEEPKHFITVRGAGYRFES